MLKLLLEILFSGLLLLISLFRMVSGGQLLRANIKRPTLKDKLDWKTFSSDVKVPLVV